MDDSDEDRLRQALTWVKKKDIVSLKNTLLSGIDVNQSVGGSTLLVEAVASGQEDLVNILLDHGANIDQGDSEVVTPLCAAAAVNRVSMVKLLLERGSDITKLADDRPLRHVTTPLHFTIMNNNPSMAKILLDAGHDPNYPSCIHKYPIIETIVMDTPQITRLLLGVRNCRVNHIGYTYGSWDFPPLYQALFQYQRLHIAQILLDSTRCNLSYHDGSYLSMLLFKAFDRTFRKLKMAKMLLEAGCDMENLDRKGKTPFTTLIMGNNYIFDISSMASLMKLLINHGVRPNMEEVGYLEEYIKTEEEREFTQSLFNLVNKPMTLQEICRKFFRTKFGIFPQDKLRRLPLPESLINYLTLEGVKVYY